MSALEHWPADGIPDNPGAWLMTAARRKAVDRLRRHARYRERMRQLTAEATEMDAPIATGGPMGADDRLRLLFTCCHPALNREAQVALTLRTIGGLETAAVARAFLVPEADHRAAPRSCQAQDPRRGDPVPGARRLGAAGPPGRGAARPLPDLQRGLPGIVRRRRRATRPRPRRGVADLAAGAAHAGRARGAWPARAHAPSPGPLRCPLLGRWCTRPAAGPGPFAAGTRPRSVARWSC